MNKAKTKRKRWSEMTTEELAEATKEYDREMPGVPGKPLTAAQKAQHRQAKKMGRPKKGGGAQVIGISIERGLLKEADALAKRRKIGRSQLFVEAVEEAIAKSNGGDAAESFNLGVAVHRARRRRV
jgi:hypothetical protein